MFINDSNYVGLSATKEIGDKTVCLKYDQIGLVYIEKTIIKCNRLSARVFQK